MAPILRSSHEVPGKLEIAPAMFGMVPHWADHKLARQTYNACTETVASKPSFRDAWKRKQFCIIPAANFFEPNYETGKPVRWRIERADGGLVAIAGIWEYRPADQLLSFSMLTINADGHPLGRLRPLPYGNNATLLAGWPSLQVFRISDGTKRILLRRSRKRASG